MVKDTKTLMNLDAEDREWLGGLFKLVDERFAQMDARSAELEARLEYHVDRLDQKIERVETTLLREFHKWASPLEARLRTHNAAFRAIELEIEALSDRIAKLEQSRPN